MCNSGRTVKCIYIVFAIFQSCGNVPEEFTKCKHRKIDMGKTYTPKLLEKKERGGYCSKVWEGFLGQRGGLSVTQGNLLTSANATFFLLSYRNYSS